MVSLDLYRKLYLIRKAEEAIINEYENDEMKTPMHMSAGEEAIAAGVCLALEAEGQFLCSYRSHAIYLAVTEETDQFFAELYGKATGMAKGKAGSMHLSRPEMGFFGASAIVASTLPVAVGAAFANKRRKQEKIVAVFFGDGAIDEGNFWESLNLACLKELQIIFVCEDNGYAVHTPASTRHGYQSITRIVSQFNCDVFESESTDAEVLYEIARRARDGTRTNNRPAFLHLKYYRYLEHVGVHEDFAAGYRPRGDFEVWQSRDPVEMQRRRLLEVGYDESQVSQLESTIDAQIAESVSRAKSAPFPDQDELYKDIFA